MRKKMNDARPGVELTHESGAQRHKAAWWTRPGVLTPILLAWAAAIWGLMFVDESVTSYFADDPDRKKEVGEFLQGFFLAIVWVVIPAILVSFPNGVKLVGGFIAPMLLSTIVTHVLKYAVGRARPKQGMGEAYFDPFTWDNYNSFPSGHTTAAVALALLLAIYFPKGRGVFYVWALAVALERMVDDAHYPSDLLAGAGIAVLSVGVCYRWLGPTFYNTGLNRRISGGRDRAGVLPHD